jgi:NAD(P)-dependent dehydrogenase (short-subunit alcohol dehydrogenase family)
MGTIVVTGSSGGIGRATVARLETAGHRVIGVDVRDAEITADLATPEGRDSMVRDVERACGGVLDGLVAGAGVSGAPGPVVASVNYFGAIATLERLRAMLAAGTAASAVAISSNSTTTQAGYSLELVDACLRGDEDEARRLAASDESGINTYPATKLALARWVRRQAVGPDWIGAGIRLNAIAPGFIKTPMTEAIEQFVFDLPPRTRCRVLLRVRPLHGRRHRRRPSRRRVALAALSCSNFGASVALFAPLASNIAMRWRRRRLSRGRRWRRRPWLRRGRGGRRRSRGRATGR